MGLATANTLNIPDTKTALNQGGHPVFYAVVMGNLAYRHQVSLWLYSLRKVGNWNQEAVLATDKPGCLVKTLQESKVIGDLISSDEEVEVYGPGEGMDGNTHIVRRPHADSINKMKLEKARAWHNIEAAKLPRPVAFIMYTDEDIVIAKDVHNFMGEYVTRIALHPNKFTIALFQDTGKSQGELHTGIVAIFPTPGTVECLSAWGKKLTGIDTSDYSETQPTPEDVKELNLKEKPLWTGSDAFDSDQESIDNWEYEGPDQKNLGKTKQCFSTSEHHGIAIFPKSALWFPDVEGMAQGNRAEFVHFTNTGRWRMIDEAAIKKYLETIGIPKYIDPMGHTDMSCALEDGGDMFEDPAIKETKSEIREEKEAEAATKAASKKSKHKKSE